MRAKEGIVLNQEGETIFSPPGASENPRAARGIVIRGGWGLAALLGVGIPLVLAAGTMIFGLFLAFMIIAWLVRIPFKLARH